MSALPTLKLKEELTRIWEPSFQKLGLTLVGGLGKQRPPTAAGASHRLFHLADRQGNELIWLQLQQPVRNPLDGVEYSLVQFINTPNMKDGLDELRRLVAAQFECLLLASGARRIEKKSQQRLLARCSERIFGELQKTISSLESTGLKVSFQEENAIRPFALLCSGRNSIPMFAGNLIRPMDNLSHYVGILQTVGKGTLAKTVSQFFSKLLEVGNGTEMRLLRQEDMSEPVGN